MAHQDDLPGDSEASAGPVLNLNSSASAGGGAAATTTEAGAEVNSLKCDE